MNIIFILLACFPLCLSSELLKLNKQDMLDKAIVHKRLAVNHLTIANEMCLYIPDLECRTHMAALISSTVSTIMITNVKDKFLAVGLALIGGLSGSLYEKYCEYRNHLLNAAYHLEQYKWYSQISIKFNDSEYDEGSQYYLKAIDYLTCADMMTLCIHEDDIRLVISDIIIGMRNLIFNNLNNFYGVVDDDFLDNSLSFVENFDEILSDLKDNDLRSELSQNINNMLYSLYSARENWWFRND